MIAALLDLLPFGLILLALSGYSVLLLAVFGGAAFENGRAAGYRTGILEGRLQERALTAELDGIVADR